MNATDNRLPVYRTMTAALFVAANFLAVVAPAPSATFTWTGTGVDSNWSTAANWAGDTPTSASDAIIVFAGSHSGQALQPIQDIADPFRLNRFEILTGAGTFSISGLPLEFVADGTIQPTLYSTRGSTSTLSNDIVIPDGTTLHVNLTTYHLNFTGVISGEGGIDKASSAGGIDLTNSANSFSGGLTIRASDGNWRKVNVKASDAMGTGLVNLHGGTLGTSYTNPGGLIFFGTTSHSNTINLFEDSPIFAGLPADTADVALSGAVNLGAHTLHLRGGGTGTMSGAVSDTGGVAKRDGGTWTLSGNNTYTGATTIAGGVLSVNTLANGGAASSIGQSTNAAGNLIFDGGVLRYTGGDATTDRRFTITTGGNAIFDVAEVGATLTFNSIQNSSFGGTNAVITKDGAGTLVFGREGHASSYLTSIGALVVNEGHLGTLGANVQINASRLAADGAAITMGDGTHLSLGTALSITNAATEQVVRYVGTTSTAAISGGFVLSGPAGSPGDGTFNTKTFDVDDGAAEVDLHVSSEFGIWDGSGSNAVSNLVKAGPGTLKLSSAGSRYRGETVVRDGRIVVGANAASGANGALGNATSAIRMGDAETPTGAGLALVTDGAFSIGRNIDVHDFGATTTLGGISNHASTFAGTVTLNKDVLLTSAATGANTTVFSGPITGAGGIVKTGLGVVTLSGANNYSGATTVHHGTLALGAANVIPDGSGKGNVLLAPAFGQTAIFDLNGFSETINGLSNSGDGTSVVDNAGAAAATLTVGNNDASSMFAGTIQNTGAGLSVTKTGAGTLVLTGSNTYTGITTIIGGVLSVDSLANGGSPSSIGQSSNARANLVINNSMLRYTGGNATTDRRFTLQGEAVFDVVDENTTLTFSGLHNGSENSVFGSVIVKDGPGTLVFQRSGGPSAHIATVDALVVNGGTLATGSGSSTVQVNLTRTAASGPAIIMGDAAVLSLTKALAVGSADGNQIVRYVGTTSTATISGSFTFSGPNSGGFNTKTFDVNNGDADIDLHVSSSFSIYPSNPPAVSNLVKTGEGTLKLSGSDSRYSGETVVRDGRIVVGANAASGANGALGNATSAIRMGDAETPTGAGLALVTDGAFTIGRSVDVHDFGAGTTLGGISNHASTFAGTVTLNKDVLLTSAATGANTTVFSGPITGAGGIVKTGLGVVTLSGEKAYLGNTLVNTGTLALNHAASSNNVASSPLVMVAGGATLDVTGLAGSTFEVAGGQTLGGAGTIAGATTIMQNARLATGMSVGALEFTGNLTLEDGAIWDWEFLGRTPGEYDQVIGPELLLPVGGMVTLNIAGLDGHMLSAGDSFTLFEGDVRLGSDLVSPGTDLTGLFQITDTIGWWGDWEITAGSLILTAVPEPGSWLLLLSLLASGLVVRRWR